MVSYAKVLKSSLVLGAGAVAAAVLIGCAPEDAPPPSSDALLDEVAGALGGWEALEGAERLEVATEGRDEEPLQASRPGVDGHQINTFQQTLLVDFSGPSLRLDFDGERTWPAPAPIRFSEVVNGDAAMLELPDGDGGVDRSPLHPSRTATRLRDVSRLPPRLLVTAREAGSAGPVEEREVDGEPHFVLQYEDRGHPVELFVEPESHLPSRVAYLESDPLLGDVWNELRFQDWEEVEGGLVLPHQWVQYLDDMKIREERVQEWRTPEQVDTDAFAIPEDVREEGETGERVISQWPLRRAHLGVGYQSFAREQNVELEEVAPGIIHVTGDSHHSMAVELEDFLVVVEMPLFPERSEAVLEALEDRFPDKPVRYGVITHFHMDHSGGVRTYAAHGATILAHEVSAPFFREILERPSTVRPDRLEREGLVGEVEAVSGMYEISDGTRSVELHPVENPHSDDMLVAYVPEESLLFVSDLHSPGAPVSPDNENQVALYEGVVEAGLQVERVVGGHGGVAPFAELEEALGGGNNGR